MFIFIKQSLEQQQYTYRRNNPSTHRRINPQLYRRINEIVSNSLFIKMECLRSLDGGTENDSIVKS